jgi:uncharacterized protein (DUF58 family)
MAMSRTRRTTTRRVRVQRRNRLVSYAAAFFVIALFALFTPNRTVRYLAASSVLIVLFSWLYSRLAISFLNVTKEDEVLRGHKLEAIPITLIVENRGLLPLPYVTVRDVIGRLSAQSMGQFLTSLPGGSEERLTYDVVGQKIGEYYIGPVELAGYDPLGLFPWKREFDVRTRIVVYPNVYRIETPNLRGLPSGNLAAVSKIYEDVTQFRSIREYSAGDEMKRINWKVTARMGKLFSTEFQPTLYFPVLILLNLSADDYPMRYRDGLVERACEVAASLVFYYVGIRQEVGLATTGKLGDNSRNPSAEIKSGYGHALGLMEIISCSSLAEGSADYQSVLFGSGPKVPMGTRLLVVGPRPKEAQGNALLGAVRRSIAVEFFQVIASGTADELAVLGDIKTYPVLEYGEKLIHG